MSERIKLGKYIFFCVADELPCFQHRLQSIGKSKRRVEGMISRSVLKFGDIETRLSSSHRSRSPPLRGVSASQLLLPGKTRHTNETIITVFSTFAIGL